MSGDGTLLWVIALVTSEEAVIASYSSNFESCQLMSSRCAAWFGVSFREPRL
jgi:hypothetical protein